MSRWSVALVLAWSLACAGEAPVGAHICFAEGVYTTCTASGGFERCDDQLSRAGGEGASRGDASSAAVAACTEHMLSMMITGNMGDGNRSQIKTSCQTTECTP